MSSVEKLYDVLLHQSVDSRLTNLAKSQTMVKMILIISSSLRVELAASVDRWPCMERMRWAVDRTVGACGAWSGDDWKSREISQCLFLILVNYVRFQAGIDACNTTYYTSQHPHNNYDVLVLLEYKIKKHLK